MKHLLLIAIILTLAGCVTANEYTHHLRQQFVGKTMDTAINDYGPPTASAKFGDGKIYEWTRSMGYRGISSTDTGGGTATGEFERFCTWRVTADKNGVITQAGWSGNSCYNQLQPLPKN